MTKILIENGRIVDPVNQVDVTGPVYIADGKIVSVLQAPEGFLPDQIITADNLVICPGFIDLSTRLREPGQTRKASFASETKAAAAAGFTTLCLPPDTNPIIDTPAVAELVKELAKKTGYPQILPIAGVTQKLEGSELSNMLALKQAGCVAVSNASQPIKNLSILRRAMEYAASHDLLFIYRPNDPWLSHNGCVHEGKLSTRYGLPCIPDAAETVALAQCLELVELTGCRVHFGQLSCARSVQKIRQAKSAGLPVSADVAIHQLHLTEDDMIPFDSAFHVQPPLRTAHDKAVLIAAVAEGVIDCICSDHQPHDLDAKLGAFPETESGVSALETLLPLMLRLVDDGLLTLSQGIAAITQKPAHVLGLTKGALTPGFSADICVFDPERVWQADSANWRSQGVNTPFWGQKFKGKVSHIFQMGKLM